MEFSFEHHHRPGGFAHFSQAAALIIPSTLFAVATFFAFIKVADDINRLRRSIRVSNLVGIVMFLIGYCWSVVGLATVIIRVHWVTGTDFESAVVV
jgi:hypothetical protein